MMKKMISMILAAVVMVSTLAGCGSGVSKVQAPNTKTCSYEEMVSYLTSEGFIEEKAEPVNINETEGYLTDNTGGNWTELKVADEAYDYDGLYVFYWNPDDKSGLYTEIYANIAVNGNLILLGGGAALLELDAFNGNFGIACSEDYAKKDEVIKAFDALKVE